MATSIAAPWEVRETLGGPMMAERIQDERGIERERNKGWVRKTVLLCVTMKWYDIKLKQTNTVNHGWIHSVYCDFCYWWSITKIITVYRLVLCKCQNKRTFLRGRETPVTPHRINNCERLWTWLTNAVFKSSSLCDKTLSRSHHHFILAFVCPNVFQMWFNVTF